MFHSGPPQSMTSMTFELHDKEDNTERLCVGPPEPETIAKPRESKLRQTLLQVVHESSLETDEAFLEGHDTKDGGDIKANCTDSSQVTSNANPSIPKVQSVPKMAGLTDMLLAKKKATMTRMAFGAARRASSDTNLTGHGSYSSLTSSTASK